MSEAAVVALAVLVLGWALTSRRLERVGLSAPILFVAAGALLTGDRGFRVDVDAPTVHVIAELTLALVLFSDASGVRMHLSRRDVSWPARLLFIGLPLSMAAGAVVALGLFTDLTWETAGICGAALAATDAALSSQVLSDERVPEKVRRTLNVESGLNDGLATPVVILLIAATATSLGVEHAGGTRPLRELALGVAIGAVLSLLASLAMVGAQSRGWVSPGGTHLAVLALAVLCFAVAVVAEGNGFIAAFVGGFVFGRARRERVEELVELPERAAQVMAWATWFIFGATLIEPTLEHADWRTLVYAALSLTLVRMVPVLLAMVRSGASTPTTLFLGWFGPRGLASVVFALIVAEELPVSDPAVQTVQSVIGVTVLLSIVVHGVTTAPIVRRFADRLS